MHPSPHRPYLSTERAHRGARDERGVTVVQLAVGVALALALSVAVFALSRPHRSERASTPKAGVDEHVRGVVTALNRDVASTQHALPYDVEGCGHKKGQRAVVSFLSDGSAPIHTSWYVVAKGQRMELVRRVCRNGDWRTSDVLTEVSGTPIVACTPSCGRFESVRFSYTGADGLSSVVAYREAKP